MKCLNCGAESDKLLCGNCRSDEIIESIFNQMVRFSKEYCENEYLVEFSQTLEQSYMVKNESEKLLELCSGAIKEFLNVEILIEKESTSAAIDAADEYVRKHSLDNCHTQMILHYLLGKKEFDFGTADEYFDIVYNATGLCLDLYCKAMDYFGHIGDYEKADELYLKAKKEAEETSCKVLYGDAEQKKGALEQKKEQTDKWRKKPYWPSKQERREKLAAIYEAKGIVHGRVKDKPNKISEEEFVPVTMRYDIPDSYISFWLEEAGVKYLGRPTFYHIGAVKVVNGKIVDQFDKLVNPISLSWGDTKNMKDAVKSSGLSEQELKQGEDIDNAMDAFLDFSEGFVLVNTEAAGRQRLLLERGARYSGKNRINNEICDILDIAEDKGITPATRENLLSKYNLKDGENASEKAAVNVKLIKKLK